MGHCFQDIEKDGPTIDSMDNDLETGWIWVVIRIDPNIREGRTTRDYYLQGVTDHEELAIAFCQDENYFIGPLPLNTSLPERNMEWPGSYFPLKRK